MALSLLTGLRRRLAAWDGSSVEHDLAPYESRLGRILALESEFEELSDERLRDRSTELRLAVGEGRTEEVLEPLFALVREVGRRLLGLRLFDVQLLAAMAMHDGKLVEMATGEGKTLAAVPVACLAAYEGCGVHILTFNDYLARRDATWMGPVYSFLGLSVGWITESTGVADRKLSYSCDITYATAKEAGFDLLRAHLIDDLAESVQRPFHFAIVDEADSILIDEARVPLVIAGSTEGSADSSQALNRLVGGFEPGAHYHTDEYQRNVELTPRGLDQAEEFLGCGDLTEPGNLELLTGLNCALHATVLLHRDVDYIVRDGEIEIVDGLTGRVVKDRHWPDGLQAALEAKEGVKIRPEGRILSTITLQSFLRLYPRIAGMTATARSAAEELASSYGTAVVVIPPHRRSLRVDHADRIFTHGQAKHAALVEEISGVHASGRPILVGTASVRESETIGRMLIEKGLGVEVLNARDDAREATIIAEAGRLGAITISTNMAGRGIDIRLGGADQSQREEVLGLGGLYVIGTNRHESLRIDMQLRGRAGRQGDPGSSLFFVSLEDDLIVRFGVRNLLPGALMPPPQQRPLESAIVRREVARVQRIVEGQNTAVRKALEGMSRLVEEQRRTVFRQRNELLDGGAAERMAAFAPRRWAELEGVVSERQLELGARWIALRHLDRGWSDHLARIADLREGIHLLGITGFDPHAEYLRRTAGSFARMQREWPRASAESFQSAEVSEDGIDLDREELQGPSATWTYLVHDDPSRDQLATKLAGNIGFAAAAALPHVAPLLILWGLYNRLRRRRDAAEEE